MKILLLGVGLQGRAALHDLVRSGSVDEVIAADKDQDALRKHLNRCGAPRWVSGEYVDAEVPASIDHLMSRGIDVALSLLPPSYQTDAVKSAVRHGVHLVYASYVSPEVKALHEEARARDVTILPECGMDPGLDLVCLGEAVRSFEKVEEIRTYGAGFPDPRAADNPIRYKITWTMEGVLKSYYRPARIIRNNEVLDIAAVDIFSGPSIHFIDIDHLGRLEAFPNGDALKYLDALNMAPADLRHMGRYVLRWPGHAAFWKKLVDLHLLDDQPVVLDNMVIERKRFLAAAMAPHLRYGENEKDVVVVRVDVAGKKDGQKRRVIYQTVDRRDPETGLYAMNRTVGFTASIGALMIGAGEISRRGVISPVNDVPFTPFAEALQRRNIKISREEFDEPPGVC